MSFGKMAVDWEERINFDRMRKEKVAKTKAVAKKYGLEALLLFDGANVRYVAMSPGQHWSQGVQGMQYVVFPLAAEPTIFFSGMNYMWYEYANPWLKVKYAIPVIGWFDPVPAEVSERQLNKFVDQIKAELKEHGLLKEPLGMDAYPVSIVRALEKAGVQVTTVAGKAMLEARKIKTKDEVECQRMIAMIAESCFSKVKEILKPGVTEDYIRATCAHTSYVLGANWVPSPEVESGPHTWPNYGACSDRAVRPGDLMYIAYCNNQYMGYRSCLYRDFSCGKPTQAQKDAYAKTRDWLYDAIKLVKPGVTTRELAEKWPKAEEFGWPNEDAAVLMQWGHGIGLTLYEHPLVSRIWSLEYPEKLEANMTLSMETLGPTGEIRPDYPRGQGCRIEEMLRVTETGVEVLCKWPVDEITVCEL